jgi:hypothetical protein
MYGGEQISESRQERRLEHINLQLAALGQPVCQKPGRAIVLEVADNLVRNYLHHRHLLAEYLCPADRRIQEFLNAYLEEHDVDARVALPDPTFVLDQPGLARELSLPADANAFQSEYLESYRVLQGVLHNPKNDRRTTQGVFHIVAGGLRVPSDKRAVPPRVFAALFQAALRPPEEAMRLPITAGQADAAAVWVSLLVRPTVSPEVVGVAPGKRMEVRPVAPRKRCGTGYSSLDRPHGLRADRAASGEVEKEGPGIAALRRGDRAATQRRDVLALGRRSV